MEKSISELNQARIKHVLFKSKLRSYLYGSGGDKEELLQPHVCTLGVWLNEFEEKFGNSHELMELDKQHLRIHFKAQILIALYDEGKVTEAREGMEKIEEIAKDLLAAMDNLEKRLKIKA